MKTQSTIIKALACTIFILALSSLGQAQATRTWVSGLGDDVNPCSRTAPCKTFAGAISKTATNGEINALDPAGYGSVTVTKSITIDGTGQHSSILNSFTTGVTINITTAAGSDPLATVRLRNLAINGTGGIAGVASSGTRTGIRGINVSSANTRQPKVYVDNVFIHGNVNEGILWAANGGELVVKNSSIIDNGTAGMRVDSNGANGVFLNVENTRTDLNGQEGVRVEDNVKATVYNSSASNNGINGYVVITTTSASEMSIRESMAANNKTIGVFAVSQNGVSAIIRISNTHVINNLVNGLQINGAPTGQILTNQKNSITSPTQAPTGTFLDQ
jgi:hypothetical protein